MAARGGRDDPAGSASQSKPRFDATFGPWLREMREQADVPASRLARKLDMAWSHYFKMEKGQVGPVRDYERLRTIAEMIGVPEAEVYRRAGALPPNWLDLARRELEKLRAKPRRRRAKPTDSG